MRIVCLAFVISCSVIVAGQAGRSSQADSKPSLTGVRASILYASGEQVPGAEFELNSSGIPSGDSALRIGSSGFFGVVPGQYRLTVRFSHSFKKAIPVTVFQSEVTPALFVLVADKTGPCDPLSVKEMPAYFADPEFFPDSKEATISLTLFDASGAVIPQGKVEVTGSAQGASASPMRPTLDLSGSTTLRVRPGHYSVKVSANGFRDMTFKFTIGGGEILGIADVLAVGGFCDPVVVEAPGPSITQPASKDRIEPKR